MLQATRLFLDNKLGRRSFIKRLTRAGITLAGATHIADVLGAGAAGAASAATSSPHPPEGGRVVTNMTGGEVMAEFLLDWNIDYVFGLAGSEEVGLLDAFVDRTRIQYATCIHESVAMAMADGYSRSTAKTSIVQLHSIAGAAYALGQLVGSYRDRVPVVVTVGRQATDYRGQDGFLEAANLHMLPRDYAQWTWDVLSPETIPEVCRRAFMMAEAPPGGPAFVTFSKDLWEKRVPRAEILPRSRSVSHTDVTPSEQHVRAIADNLASAQFPMLFFGNETIREEISTELTTIAELIGAPIVKANKVAITIPNTHPYFCGRFDDDKALSAKVDCFWSLGGHMFKFARKPEAPLIARSATIMHTGLAHQDVGRNYPVDVAVIASIKATAQAVLKELQSRNMETSAVKARRQWVSVYATRRRRALRDAAKAAWDDRPISTARLVGEINKIIDPSAFVVVEAVTSDIYFMNYIDFDHRQPYETRRRNFDTTSGVLGWGLAAALGVKIGNPDKEVWCLVGDGCFNFGSQALWSASRYDVPVGVAIFNNRQYQANRLNQNHYQGRMVETGKYIGVSLRHPDIDYVAMAKAYDIEGEAVTDPADIAPALRRCQAVMRKEGRPYIVDVRIDTYFTGRDSDYYDKFSIGKNEPRIS